MRRSVKIVLGVVGTLVVVACGGVVYVEATWDKDYSHVAVPALAASTDPAVIAHGEYVVHALAHCQACHQNEAYFKKPLLNPDKTDLASGARMDGGPFGIYYGANLTSDAETGLGRVSDGQVARTIRHGIMRNGKLSATMAMSVGQMSDEDLLAVLSYLRSLPPRKKVVPPAEPSFLSKAMAEFFTEHQEPSLTHVPPGGVSVERGRYLANGPAFCYGCHTELDLSTFYPVSERFTGMAMAEPDTTDPAFEFIFPNLTPDPETGIIASWSEDQFVARFKATARVYAGSKMPWENFALMTEDDVRSIYRYLRTLPPTKKVVGPSRRPVGWKPPS